MSIAEALLLIRRVADIVHAAAVVGRLELTPEETARIRADFDKANARWADLAPEGD